MINDHFEIVLNGETRRIDVNHIIDREYAVLMDDRRIGTLHGEGRAKFVCVDTSGEYRLAGSTRRLAITSMIYACFKK